MHALAAISSCPSSFPQFSRDGGFYYLALTGHFFVITITSVTIEFDPAKDAINRRKHGISLALAAGFEWDTAHIEEDRRFDYEEQRFRATGYIGMRLYVLIYCLTDGDRTRIISLRPAEPKEYRHYAET